MAIRYGRGKFPAHDNYITYMNSIVENEIYKTMPNLRSTDGRINWQVSSGKTTSFYEYYVARFDWWVKVADRLNLPGTGNSNDRFSIAARIIHPTKLRACRLCGEEMYIGYMYVNDKLAKRWNRISRTEAFLKQEEICTAVCKLVDIIGEQDTIAEIKQLFPEKLEYFSLLECGDYPGFFFNSQHIRSNQLSPGYMANPPDRMDGFHDYCLHCRKSNDPGRSDENMQTYNHDRRAFMWWAEGDWKVADAIYNCAGEGVCANCGRVVAKVSPDHIGPLACGFKQSGYYEPLCGRCNSSKNRRFTFHNVESLIEHERISRESVASWQVRALWDTVKDVITNDEQAKVLSNYMRAMQDYYLRLLGEIAKRRHFVFLSCFLHPEYAYFDVSFEGLNPSTLEYDCCKKSKIHSSGSRSLAARAVRIAFEELFEYCSKPPEKRKVNRLFAAIREEDLDRIEGLFGRIAKSETDYTYAIVLLSEQYSVDEKDSRIQKIIESPSFSLRRNEYCTVLSEFIELISMRGQLLGRMCLEEIL